MTNFIEFTIKNLDLRIEKATQSLKANEIGLKLAQRDNDKAKIEKYSNLVEKLRNNIAGYKVAKPKLQSNSTITPTDAEYIIKGLNIRKKRLSENLEMHLKVIKQEERVLETKENQVMNIGGGLSASIQHYDDVSIRIIDNTKKRVQNVTNNLEHCETALKFFEGYLV